MATQSWKDRLRGQLPPLWENQIDDFETQMTLRKAGRIDEKVFAETRLRRGSYGQRYDNGFRHDGFETQTLPYPPLTKGPETFFDAPGMQRIKIPFGGMNPEQMMVLAELAEEYSDAICHITTRQDIQLHFVHIDDAPDIFRRLAAVGITTREACGNSVRNVTACPLAGVCNTETFDVTPYAKACAFYLLGHRDTQDFGRKFKIAFSGCAHEACALVSMHDLGGVAAMRDGKRGFELYVGGGLGAVPHQAKLMMEFCPEEDLLPTARAIGRVFARTGEKKNRNRARLKFVVQKLGIDEFRRLVEEELKTMPEDPSWRTFFDEIPRWDERPGQKIVQLSVNGNKKLPEFAKWEQTNVYEQRQGGYVVATITCPLGDLTSDQMRALAHLSQKYAGGNVRTTVEQNLVFRWVPREKVHDLYEDLKAIGLDASGAGTIVDVTACPGTDTCKLGIASSRGLAGELRTQLMAKRISADQAVEHLRIKISGCFNSCGQHHVADIGFYGNSRNVGGFTVPHFQVMLGGQWTENGGSYALAIGAVPSKRVPELVNTLTERYVKDRQGDESFQAWCQRIGKKQLKTLVDPFDVKTNPLPPQPVDPTMYQDWGDPRAYQMNVTTGECAGEIVSLADFGFTAAETMACEASVLLDEGNYHTADQRAYEAMLKAAITLVQLEWPDAPMDNEKLTIDEFRKRFVDSGIFVDKYHGNQFSNYLLNRFENGPDTRYTKDTAHKLIEEANLFIDAAHKAHAKWQQKLNVLAAPSALAVGAPAPVTA
jgi:sulfite reductase (ferredoxin)